jgi:hypothetical protein
MIKVLKEEPITYVDGNDPDDLEVWLYKNLTPREVEELKYKCKNLRACVTKTGDYYIGSGYWFIHDDIQELAEIESIIDLFIFPKENVMTIRLLNGSKITDLKSAYSKMRYSKLIDEDTIIVDSDGYEEDPRDWYIAKLNLDSGKSIDISEITGKLN